MARKHIDVASFASEAAESIVNGNTGIVLQEIAKLPKPQAIAVTAYLIHYLSEGSWSDQVSHVLRRLEASL
jgi:hypothetical protein